ncbi:hypothetical protein HFO38_24025 [Rhizobium leguminosarum]|uniref:tautomerase family protein n=1 Tax=Rhizobium leguminosarum TaxID=384 RepID=UPI001C946DB7|nr:tautomerase family protein [Rhizobium leguminosarum]MBY5705747.1 hypothetical protein [Rhizobium leguminosarum]
MPLYNIMTRANSLSSETKAALAAELTAFHSRFADVPTKWVHIVFLDYAADSGFSNGSPSPTVTLTLLIRSGRSAEYKRQLLAKIWELLQAATNAPDEEIVISLQEGDASNAMEMGKILPDVAAR